MEGGNQMDLLKRMKRRNTLMIVAAAIVAVILMSHGLSYRPADATLTSSAYDR